jgi:hypothetical protein
MDITSNAQVADATQIGERVSAADTSAIQPEAKEQEKTAIEGAHQFSKLDDLSHPPPGYSEGKYRDRFYKIWRPRKAPKPPPASLDDAPILPLASCSWISELLYLWINPIMTLGYQRPLQGRHPGAAVIRFSLILYSIATDLWKMDEKRTAAVLAKKFQAAYDKRQSAANAYNSRLDAGEIKPSFLRRSLWALSRGKKEKRYQRWRENKRQKASIFWTMSSVVGAFFWVGGFSKIIGDVAQLMGPLVSRDLIRFAQERAAASSAGRPGPNIGRGVGDAIGLLILTCMASIFQHFFFYRWAYSSNLDLVMLLNHLDTDPWLQELC